jgi:hypothetical protein
MYVLISVFVVCLLVHWVWFIWTVFREEIEEECVWVGADGRLKPSHSFWPALCSPLTLWMCFSWITLTLTLGTGPFVYLQTIVQCQNPL